MRSIWEIIYNNLLKEQLLIMFGNNRACGHYGETEIRNLSIVLNYFSSLFHRIHVILCVLRPKKITITNAQAKRPDYGP